MASIQTGRVGARPVNRVATSRRPSGVMTSPSSPRITNGSLLRRGALAVTLGLLTACEHAKNGKTWWNNPIGDFPLASDYLATPKIELSLQLDLILPASTHGDLAQRTRQLMFETISVLENTQSAVVSPYNGRDRVNDFAEPKETNWQIALQSTQNALGEFAYAVEWIAARSVDETLPAYAIPYEMFPGNQTYNHLFTFQSDAVNLFAFTQHPKWVVLFDTCPTDSRVALSSFATLMSSRIASEIRRHK